MKRRQWLITGLAVIIGVGCTMIFLLWPGVSAQNAGDPVVLKTKESVFTESQVRTRMDLYCKKYSYTTEKLYEEPKFWNQMVQDIVYEYASGEIAREISDKNQLGELNDGEIKQAQAFYDSVLSDIDKLGENQSNYLKRLGFTEKTLWTFSENQAYAARIQAYWAQDLKVSSDPAKASYEKLLNYTRRMWEEINARVDSGEYVIDESSLLQKVNEKKGE